MKKEKGFTLIELMVVVVIIGILAAVALPRFVVQQKKAKEGAAWADLDAMTTALEMYYLDCDEYPSPTAINTRESDVLSGLVSTAVGGNTSGDGWAGPYMKFRSTSGSIPLDPWNHGYLYDGDDATNAQSFTVWSRGASDDYSAIYINSGWFSSPR